MTIICTEVSFLSLLLKYSTTARPLKGSNIRFFGFKSSKNDTNSFYLFIFFLSLIACYFYLFIVSLSLIACYFANSNTLKFNLRWNPHLSCNVLAMLIPLFVCFKYWSFRLNFTQKYLFFSKTQKSFSFKRAFLLLIKFNNSLVSLNNFRKITW